MGTKVVVSLGASLSLALAMLFAGSGRAADPLPNCTGLSVQLAFGDCIESPDHTECHQVQSLAPCYMYVGDHGLTAIEGTVGCAMLYRGDPDEYGVCICDQPLEWLPTPRIAITNCKPVF